MIGATLTNATFAEANLCGANLSGADLTGVRWVYNQYVYGEGMVLKVTTCPDGSLATDHPINDVDDPDTPMDESQNIIYTCDTPEALTPIDIANCPIP